MLMSPAGIPGTGGKPIIVRFRLRVTFTRSAPLSSLTKASKRHATHGSKSVPLTPLVPLIPLVPLTPWFH